MTEIKPPFLEDSLEAVPCGHTCRALAFLQQIYHAAPVGMVVIDHKHEIVRLNRKFAEMIDSSTEACIGIRPGILLPTLSKRLTSLLDNVLADTDTYREQEFAFRLNGEPRNWSITAYPVRCSDSDNPVVSLIIHDITQLRKTEEELNQALGQIKALQEKLSQENKLLKTEITREHDHAHMVGSSQHLREVNDKIRQVAPTDAIVLITGETGTGKELAAREIHRRSQRHDQPLIIVNCAAMPANLIESELFGHEKGSFTGAIARKTGRFEVADKGTIFLDEIGEMPLELQSKLLRVLQENQIERIGSHQSIDIDVRVVAATNRILHEEVIAGRFREDLFFRLNVFPIHMPALRERGNDIIEIAFDYMTFCARKHGRQIKTISESSQRRLLEYNWPGNIRELRNLVERSVILCQTDTLELEIPYLSEFMGKDASKNELIPAATLEEVQKKHILQILNQTAWRVRGEGGAAEKLGLKPTTLESKMKKLGISRKNLPS